MNVLGTHLYQYTSWHWCDRLLSASVNYFFKHFQCICPFHNGRFTSTPVHTMLSVQQFLTKKRHYPHAPYPHSPDLAQVIFFLFPQTKKVFRGKCFADGVEVKQKMAEALKGIKINEFKNCFEQWKSLNRCIASNRGYFEVT